MEVLGKKFGVRFDMKTATIRCYGIFDGQGKEEYRAIVGLFKEVVDLAPKLITLDVREVEFLNSSGISAIGSGLMIPVRTKGESRLAIHCSTEFPWQRRSMEGLARLMPDVELIFK